MPLKLATPSETTPFRAPVAIRTSSVPAKLMLALYFGALLTMGALGYQFGLADNRQVVLSSLLLLMWSGGMLLIVELSQPRLGDIRVDAAPLVWVIQGFGQK